ncbi:hypothetical protein BDN70DRAFT_937918 [Pholiota conissans]|uniref:Uncharacterized protein n=1 Tax=Pholiota conissans TaxID=109636 RepID=A0A9P6CNF4_9AGAR|nr:hypothetical protein BDN70DRAFT_937918 [Pholiota conissans]
MANSGQNSPPNTPYTANLPSSTTNFTSTWNSPGTGFSNYYSTPFSPTPSHFNARATLGTPVQSKRKFSGKENSHAVTDRNKRTKKPSLTISDKVKLFHGFLKNELQWSYSEALFYTSQATSSLDFNDSVLASADSRIQKWAVSRESITATLQHFFNGHVDYPPSKIIESWYKHPYGRLERESDEMYSTDTPYTDIKPVRPALSSFAAQAVLQKLTREADSAIATSSGLHLALSNKPNSTKKIEWRDIGAMTFENAEGIIKARTSVSASTCFHKLISFLLASSFVTLLIAWAVNQNSRIFDS